MSHWYTYPFSSLVTLPLENPLTSKAEKDEENVHSMNSECKSVVRSRQAFKNQNDFLKCESGKG